MKVLAWYSALLLGYLQLYYLHEMLFTQAKSDSFWAFALFAPVCVFVVKYLIKTTRKKTAIEALTSPEMVGMVKR